MKFESNANEQRNNITYLLNTPSSTATPLPTTKDQVHLFSTIPDFLSITTFPPHPNDSMHRYELVVCLLTLPFPQIRLLDTHKSIFISDQEVFSIQLRI